MCQEPGAKKIFSIISQESETPLTTLHPTHQGPENTVDSIGFPWARSGGQTAREGSAKTTHIEERTTGRACSGGNTGKSSTERDCHKLRAGLRPGPPQLRLLGNWKEGLPQCRGPEVTMLGRHNCWGQGENWKKAESLEACGEEKNEVSDRNERSYRKKIDSPNPNDTARLFPNLMSIRQIAPKREIQT